MEITFELSLILCHALKDLRRFHDFALLCDRVRPLYARACDTGMLDNRALEMVQLVGVSFPALLWMLHV